MLVSLAVARTSGLGEKCLPGFTGLKTYSETKINRNVEVQTVKASIIITRFAGELFKRFSKHPSAEVEER